MANPYLDLLKGNAQPTESNNDNPYLKLLKTTKQAEPAPTPPGKVQVKTLPSFLGGGAYNVGPDKTKVVNTGHGTYGGEAAAPDQQRDDIVPVSLGGANSSARNIRMEQDLPKKEQTKFVHTPTDALEIQTAKDFKAGKLTLGQARLKVLTAKQEQDFKPSKKQNVKDFIASIPGGVDTTSKQADKAMGLLQKIFSYPADLIIKGSDVVGKTISASGQYLADRIKPVKDAPKKSFKQIYRQEPGGISAVGKFARDAVLDSPADNASILELASGKKKASGLTIRDVQKKVATDLKNTTFSERIQAQLPDLAAGVAELIITGGLMAELGTELSTKYLKGELTAEELKTKLDNGEIEDPHARAIAQQLVDQNKGLKVDLAKPAGGLRQVVGEYVMGGQAGAGGSVETTAAGPQENPYMKLLTSDKPALSPTGAEPSPEAQIPPSGPPAIGEGSATPRSVIPGVSVIRQPFPASPPSAATPPAISDSLTPQPSDTPQIKRLQKLLQQSSTGGYQDQNYLAQRIAALRSQQPATLPGPTSEITDEDIIKFAQAGRDIRALNQLADKYNLPTGSSRVDLIKQLNDRLGALIDQGVLTKTTVKDPGSFTGLKTLYTVPSTASPDIAPFVDQTNQMKVVPLDQAIKKFDETGSVTIAQKPGARLVVKDEGDYVNVGIDTGSLVSTDVKLPTKIFATKEEAFAFVKQITQQNIPVQPRSAVPGLRSRPQPTYEDSGFSKAGMRQLNLESLKFPNNQLESQYQQFKKSISKFRRDVPEDVAQYKKQFPGRGDVFYSQELSDSEVYDKFLERYNTEKSIMLRAGIPGVEYLTSFINRDLIPAGKAGIQFLKDVAGKMADFFKTDLPKQDTAANLAAALAKEAHLRDVAYNAIRKEIKFWAQVPEADRLDVITKIQTNQVKPEDFTKYGPGANLLSKLAYNARIEMASVWDDEFAAGIPTAFRENYLPQMWENAGKATLFYENMARKIGKAAFQKKRDIDLYIEGIQFGLVPKTTNIGEIVLARKYGSFKVLALKQFLDKELAQGRLKFTEDIQDSDMQITAVDHKVINVQPSAFFPGKGGKITLPESSANLVNRHFSPSKWENKYFRGFVTLKSTAVSAKLAFSAYHAVSTGISSMAVQLNLAWNLMESGQWAAGLKALAKTPVSIPVDLFSKDTNALMKAWKRGAIKDTDAEALSIMFRGGFRIGLDSEQKAGFDRQIQKALVEFHAQNPAGALIRAGAAGLTAGDISPLMSFWVPRLKAAGYMKMARAFITANPKATEEQINRQLLQISKNMDDMFGQMILDNRFWNRTARDLAVASMTSVGWGGGTAEWLLGGARDTMIQTANIFKKGTKAQVTDRMKLLVTYTLITGLIGGMITYIMTKKRPQKMIDYFAPQDGTTNPDGSPGRVSIPSMVKEAVGYRAQIQKSGLVLGSANYASGKLAPTYSALLDILKNKDYYGVDITKPNDPLFKRTKDQILSFLAQGYEPISVQSAQKTKDAGGNTMLSYLGFSRAPKYLTETKAQEAIWNIYDERFPSGSKSQAQAEKDRAKAQARQQIQAGKDSRGIVSDLIKKGYITERGKAMFIKDAKIPADIIAFGRLTKSDQQALWDNFSAEDKNRYRKVLKKGIQ